MPKFYVYLNEEAYKADKWAVGSYLGLVLTQANADKVGHTVILRVHDGKVYRKTEQGGWRA